MVKWEYKSWAVASEGCGPEFYDTREVAEAEALAEADGSPGMRFALYQCVGLIEAKVSKAKVRPWRRAK